MLQKIGNKMSLSEHAYQVLKEAIINKTFKPRDILLEESIAEMLGVSRTPLRTALKRLEYERLVFINSSKQAVVAEINLADMEKIFVFRYAIEPVLVRVVCAQITDEQLTRIEDCLERNKVAIKAKDFTATLECELEFDRILAVSSGNEFFSDSIGTIHTCLQRFLALSSTHSLDSPESLVEHSMIFEALQERNIDKAEKSARQHVCKVASRLQVSLPI